MMTADPPKPAAALTAERIKRGSLWIGPAGDVGVPAPPARADETPAAADESWGLAEPACGFLTWRRAGLFGLLYVGALTIFAAVFDVWPAFDR